MSLHRRPGSSLSATAGADNDRVFESLGRALDRDPGRFRLGHVALDLRVLPIQVRRIPLVHGVHLLLVLPELVGVVELLVAKITSHGVASFGFGIEIPDLLPDIPHL